MRAGSFCWKSHCTSLEKLDENATSFHKESPANKSRTPAGNSSHLAVEKAQGGFSGASLVSPHCQSVELDISVLGLVTTGILPPDKLEIQSPGKSAQLLSVRQNTNRGRLMVFSERLRRIFPNLNAVLGPTLMK